MNQLNKNQEIDKLETPISSVHKPCNGTGKSCVSRTLFILFKNIVSDGCTELRAQTIASWGGLLKVKICCKISAKPHQSSNSHWGYEDHRKASSQKNEQVVVVVIPLTIDLMKNPPAEESACVFYSGCCCTELGKNNPAKFCEWHEDFSVTGRMAVCRQAG